MTLDWKAITNQLIERHRQHSYGYVSLAHMWNPDTAPRIVVGGREALLVDVLPGSELVISSRDARQKQLRRWLWDLRDQRALSPHRLGRTVVWHMWDSETDESLFGIAAFSRYDAAERLERMRGEETTNGCSW